MIIPVGVSMEYVVKIIDYDHQGRGIAKIDNKIVFIPNTIIDEEVKIKIVDNKKNYMEGIVINYLKESPIRRKDVCPYYEKCGGCSIMHLPYSEQLKYKQNKINNILKRYLKMDIKVKDIIPSDNEFYYRNKVTLHVDNNHNVGYYENKSNKIVKIDKCLLLDNKLNEYIKNMKKITKDITLRTNGVKVLDDNSTIIKTIGNYKFNVSLESFFQVNDNVTYKMYEKIKEYALATKKDNILDLYCGTGTIGIYLSNTCHEVLGIEINKQAIIDANKNKELNNIKNISFIADDVSNIITNLNFKPDIIIVDPPRAGLDHIAIDTIIKLHPQKIIYTSCDPMTLVRDLNILKEYYQIKELTPFDMFPNTYHIESVVLLERK